MPILAHEREDPVKILEIGEAIPNIELTDHNGDAFNLESAHGKVVVISFMYTKCPDVCPLQTTKIRQAQEMLGEALKDDVMFVTISFDIEDTPEILKDYALFHKADLSNWKFLGSQDEHEIKDAVESLGLTYEKTVEGLFSHGMFMYLSDTDLTVSKMYLGQFLDPNDLVNDISDLLPSSTDWTIPIIVAIIVGIAAIGSLILYKKNNKKENIQNKE